MMVPITGCRSCAAESLHTILDLGTTPLANALVAAADLDRPQPSFPLTLLFCAACGLVQIRETVDPEILFRHYFYLSSFSTTMLEHARHAADSLCPSAGLGPESLVVEIASNDGYLLKNFVAWGIPVLGIEPAANIAAVAVAAGVPTLAEFFGRDLAQKLAAEGRQADLILANNVLAHVADSGGFVAGIEILLRPGGRAVLEFPYLGDMIDGTEFDTIYHEHLCYFSLHAARNLFGRHGLAVTDVERLPIHGGSLRVTVMRAGESASPAPVVHALLEQEEDRGLTRVDAYRAFAAGVERIRRDLLAEIGNRRRAGETLAAYGASAKGATLLNTVGLSREHLAFVADRSTVKQGLYTPGTLLPIVPPEALLSRRPDAVLLLTWNFAAEIFRQQAAYLEAGGLFILPIPQVRVVGKEALA
jgi:SAM-dependent methyltransferase